MKRLLAAVLGLVLLTSGCGIPDNTAVQEVGRGPSAGPAATASAPEAPPVQQATMVKSQFTENFLEAAAGDPERALEDFKQYLSPTSRATFKPATGVLVVRLTEQPLVNQSSVDVSFRAQPVGTLGRDGVLAPATDLTVRDYQITVKEVPGETGLFVTKPPQQVMISEAALNKYYERRPIYFWNTENSALVPDVRFMSKVIPEEQRPTQVLNWLTGAPAPWLTDAVEPLPDGTSLVGVVPAASNNTLRVSLSDQAVPPDNASALDRLRIQLMWSLRPYLPDHLELTVGNRDPQRYDGDDYLNWNPSYLLADIPQRFVLYDGKIRRMERSELPNDPVPVLSPAENTGLSAASFASTRAFTYAAVVRGGGQQLAVARAASGAQVELRPVSVPGPVGQPTWAVAPDETTDAGVGLVIGGDGNLYSFTAGGGAATRVDWPGPPGRFTAVAAAPDAHRVALIADGRLYLVALAAGGDGIQLGTPVWVPTPTLRSLSAVEWSGEAWLVLAGVRASNDRSAVLNLAIDGALQTDRRSDLGTEGVEYLATYPARPSSSNSEQSTYVSLMAGGRAYDVLSDLSEITAESLAEPVPNPPSGVRPIKPFFLR